MSESQEQELLGAWWSIIIQFVDLGFEIEPVQRAKSITSNPRPDDRSTNEADGLELGVRR